MYLLRALLFIKLCAVVFCNLEVTYNYEIESCLLKLLRRQMGRTATTFKVIPETNTSALQDDILKALNNQSKWLLQIATSEIEQYDFFSNSTLKPNLAQNVLLLLASVETFEERLEDLLLSERVYRGFQLVVVLLEMDECYEEIASRLMRTAWDYKLFATTVITQTKLPGEWCVYDVQYQKEIDRRKKCIDNIIPKISLRCSNNTLKRMFFNSWNKKSKFPCSVDVISFELPPFVVNQTTGFEVQLVQTLGEHINVDFELLIEKNGTSNWGDLNESNSTWSGRLGLVQRKSGVAIGNLRVVTSLQRHFDFSDGYYYDKLVWVVPVAQLAPRWMCIFMPFSFALWLFCIFIFVAGGVLLCFSFVKKERSIYRKLNRTLFVALETFLGFGTKRAPITRMTRAVFVSLAFCSIFFSSVYQGTLINVLTRPVYQHQIKTLEEIVKSGLSIGGFKHYREYFNVSNDEPSMRIWRVFKTVRNGNIYDWLQMVATHRNVATIASELYVKYLIASGDPAVVSDGFPKIYVLKEVVVPITTSILMPKGFPLQERINTGIQRIIANGVAIKLNKKAISTLEKYESRKEAIFSGKDVLVLTMDNVQGAFVLLMLGHACALFIFVVELISHKFRIWNKWVRYKRRLRREVFKWFVGKRT